MAFGLKSFFTSASLFLFVLVGTEVLCYATPEDCSPETLMKCKGLNGVNYTYASSEEELQAMCSVLHDEIRCIDSFTRKCFEPAQRAYFNNLYAGSSMTLQEICQPGPFRDRFLRHSPCLKSLVNPLSRCENEFNARMKVAEENNDFPQVNVCGSFREYVSCSKAIVKSNCGEETAIFSAGLFEKMAMALMQGLVCAQQDSLELASSSASALSPLSSLAFFLILCELFNHLR